MTATPFTIPDLRKRWGRSHPGTTSGYGDGHQCQYVETPAPDDAHACAEEMGIPPGISRYLYALSGGYPECFNELLRVVCRREISRLHEVNKKILEDTATQRLGRFVQAVDEVGQSVYRDAMTNLYHGIDTDDALDRCKLHPWHKVLLNEDNDLRAERLGPAAIAESQRDATLTVQNGDMERQIFDRAVAVYRNGRFAEARRLFESIQSQRSSLSVTQTNAAVMSELISEHNYSEDLDWKKVTAETARARCHTVEAGLSEGDRAFLLERLGEAEGVAKKLAGIQNDRAQQKRVVDRLAGLQSGEKDIRIAAFLLVLKYEACSGIPGHFAACQAALSLPEQLLRVWGYWALGINYYETPVDADEIWEEADVHWPTRQGALRRSAQGEEFPSLLAYGYFTLAASVTRNADVPLPVDDFDELQSVFSWYEQLRNPQAHSYCFTNRKEREKFFSLTNRWLDCVISVCEHVQTKDELLGLMEPLPLVGFDNKLIYQ